MLFLFFHDTATTEIYTLSLTTLFRSQSSDECSRSAAASVRIRPALSNERSRFMMRGHVAVGIAVAYLDRKSTRLNSSHSQISYAVFCLKKKKFTFNSYYFPQLVKLMF